MLAVVFADYRRKLMYEKTDKPENLSEAKKQISRKSFVKTKIQVRDLFVKMR